MNDIYAEDFVVIVDKEAVEYKVNSILEEHNMLHGWTADDPILEDLGNGQVKITIHLIHDPAKDVYKNHNINRF